jgi:hypothetical protein
MQRVLKRVQKLKLTPAVKMARGFLKDNAEAGRREYEKRLEEIERLHEHDNDDGMFSLEGYREQVNANLGVTKTQLGVAIRTPTARDKRALDVNADRDLVMDFLERAIRHVMERQNVLEGDSMGVGITTKITERTQLNFTTSIPLETVTAGNFAANLSRKLIERVVTLLNSNESIRLEDLIVTSTIIRRERGARRLNCVYVNEMRSKKTVIAIKNDDHMCAIRAILALQKKRDADREAYKRYMNRGGSAQLREDVEALAAKIGVDPKRGFGLTHEEIELIGSELMMDILIIDAVSFHMGNPEMSTRINYGERPNPARTHVLLYHPVPEDAEGDSHYDAINNLEGFLGRFWCHGCSRTYKRKGGHVCEHTGKRCGCCKKTGCAGVDGARAAHDGRIPWRRCQDCMRSFPSAECFENHLDETCNIWHKCEGCGENYMAFDENKPAGQYNREHICGHEWCKLCKQMYDSKKSDKHVCYVQPCELKIGNPDDYIFFDFETDQSTGEHVVNLSVAQYSDGTEFVHRNIDEFCQWLFTAEHRNKTVIAHNGRGFDFILVLRWMYEHNQTPSVVFAGGKIMMMSNKRHNIRFVDSLNFMTKALRGLPKMVFSKQEISAMGIIKGDFPHLWNTEELADYCGEPPSPDDFDLRDATADRAKEITEFCAELRRRYEDGIDWNLQEELLKYCRDDVRVLRLCCMKFRELFIETAGVDPFQYTTIAKLCSVIFRASFMPENSLAIIAPVKKSGRSTSEDAWLSQVCPKARRGVTLTLKTADGKQKRARPDGIVGKHVFEFDGCHWHGCKDCYPSNRNTLIKGGAKTLEEAYRDTKERDAAYKRAGFKLTKVRECDWKKTEGGRDFYDKLASGEYIHEKLDPTEAMFGGRVECFQKYWKSSGEDFATYQDFTSLYPSVQFANRYPCGLPEVILPTNPKMPTPERFMRRLTRGKYFGVAKVHIEPPKNLRIPLLPRKAEIEGEMKLLFDLVDRTGTYSTLELAKAVQLGYKITRVYEIHHFKETREDIYTEYIKTFLKIKQESSGWPDWVLNAGKETAVEAAKLEHCSETGERYEIFGDKAPLKRWPEHVLAACDPSAVEQAKREYIADYERRQGIALESEKIVKNPGLRALAKLCLNSLWGKQAQRLNMPKTKTVRTRAQFREILLDPRNEVIDVPFMSENVAEVQYRLKDEFVEPGEFSNIYCGVFTTAYARIKLYNAMEGVGDPRRVLYCDTDSLIYTVQPGEDMLPLGDLLGELTDELEYGERIIEFCSGGPKNYAYTVEDRDGKRNTHLKIKGFSLNKQSTKELLNYMTMKEVVLGERESIAVPDRGMKRTKQRKIINKPQDSLKVYSRTGDKRLFQDDYTSVPYGWQGA